MNGKALDIPWFSHDDLINGGTLVLEMGEKPGSIWRQAQFSDMADAK
jgi:putative alpha-1,2-mannosidase